MAEPWEEYSVPTAAPAAARRKSSVYSEVSPGTFIGTGEDGEEYTVDAEGNELLPGEEGYGLVGRVTDDSLPLPAPRADPNDPTAEYAVPGEEAAIEIPGGADYSNTEPEAPEVGTGEAIWEGVKGGGLMGFGDEIQGLGGGVGSWISGRGFQSGYEQELANARGTSDAAWDQNPWAYAAGYVPGMLASGWATRMRSPMPQNPTTWQRFARGGMEGSRQGAISGAGNSEEGWGSRAVGAGVGGALGVPLGMLGVPLSDAVGYGFNRFLNSRLVKSMTPGGNNLNSGLDALATRAPQDATALRAGQGRLVDRVDESGRGVIRDAAGKMTPAREEVARHADEVYASAQDRVSEVARREIAPEPQTARQLERQVRGDKNLGGDDEAGVLMGEAMEPLRTRAIVMDDGLKEVLGTREGQAALRAAEGLMTDPAERAAARRLLAAARQHAKGPVDPEDAFRAEVKGWDDLPQAVKDAYRAQRPDLMEQADPFEGVTLSLDTADKFARAMRGRAAKTPGLERVSRQFANTVRNAARNQIPEYAKGLDEYAQRMGVADAAGGTGKFEDTHFLRTPSDLFADSLRMAAREGPPQAPRFTPEQRAAYLRAYQNGYDDVGPDGPISAQELGIEPFFQGAEDAVYGGGEGGLAEGLNYMLRSGQPLPPKAQRMFDAIIEEFQLTPPSQQEQFLSRIIGLPEGGLAANSRGFSSTSRSEETIEPVIDNLLDGQEAELMDIQVPSGQRTIRMKPSDTWGDEGEVLLPPGRFTRLEGEPELGYDVPEMAAATRRPYTFEGDVPPRPAGVSELDALRRRARDEVVDAATSGTGSGAGRVAKQIAFGGGESGAGQAARNEALLGSEGARRLERGMELEVNRVRNTDYIDPRRGSQTQSRSQDAIVDGFIDAAANATTGGWWAMVRTGAKWLKQGGIRGIDAERLARDAISEDPVRINAAIDYLEQKGMRRERATRFVNAYGSALMGRTAGAVSDDGDQTAPPPNSVRSLYRNTGAPSNAAN